MTFAKRVFAIAGIAGIAAVLPMYMLEQRLGRDLPPPITHPEYFYGFIGVVLACQVMFLVIATDPQRYRPLMLVAILEKAGFVIPTLLLVIQDRVAVLMLGPALADLTLGILFALAWARTPKRP